jgi:Protein of unknown function (DUF1194)
VQQRIDFALVQWSSRRRQALAVGWRILAGAADLEAAAKAVETANRQWAPGGTGLAAAIGFCAALLEAAPFAAARRVIDVSGDGEENDGGDVDAARAAALARGITIKGLPILTGSSTIEAYYRQRVTGGLVHLRFRRKTRAPSAKR